MSDRGLLGLGVLLSELESTVTPVSQACLWTERVSHKSQLQECGGHSKLWIESFSLSGAALLVTDLVSFLNQVNSPLPAWRRVGHVGLQVMVTLGCPFGCVQLVFTLFIANSLTGISIGV